MAKRKLKLKKKAKSSFAPTKAQLSTIAAITKHMTKKESELEKAIEEVRFSLRTRFESFNMRTGYDGLPIGQLVEVHGPEFVGKTLWSLSVLADAQAQGHLACYLELEKAVDPGDAATTGLDLDSLITINKLDFPPATLRETHEGTTERISVGVNRLIKKFKKVRDPDQFLIIVVDSMPALICERQIAEGVSKATFGSQTAMIGEWQKILNALIGKSHAATVIFLNQERSNIPQGFSVGRQQDWKPWGGRAAHFFINLRARIAGRKQIKNSRKEIIGNEHYCGISKTKRGKEGGRWRFCSKTDGVHNFGLWVPQEFLVTGIETGLFKKVTGGYSYRKKIFSQADLLLDIERRGDFYRDQLRGK